MRISIHHMYWKRPKWIIGGVYPSVSVRFHRNGSYKSLDLSFHKLKCFVVGHKFAAWEPAHKIAGYTSVCKCCGYTRHKPDGA